MDSKGDNLNVYYQNVRGLRTKTTAFYRNICLNSYDVVVLTETWLNDSISDSELFDDRFMVWRRDRDYTLTCQDRGGGVLIAIRKDLTVTAQPSYHSTAEDLWLSLSITSKNSSRPTILHLCVLYLCKQNNGYSFSSQLHNFLSKLAYVLLMHPDDKYLVLGDFNLSNIQWTSNGLDSHILYPSNVSSNDETTLIDDLNMHNLNQFNGFLNIEGRILDLVLSNDIVTITDCDDAPLVPIDPLHRSLLIRVQFIITPSLKPNSYVKYLYNKGNYEQINKELSSVSWNVELRNKPLDEAIGYFYDVIRSLRDKHIPTGSFKSQFYPKWYSAALIKLIKEKYKFIRKYRIYNNKTDLLSFKCLRDRARNLEHSCYLNFMASVEDSIEKNPKYFWSFLKSRSKSNSMPTNIKYNNVVATSGESICNSFSSYFLSTFLSANYTDVSNFGSIEPIETSNVSQSQASINSIHVNKLEVSKILSNLDPSKSAGPDHLHSILLIKCAETISIPISILFERSCTEGSFPALWKSAFVTPIHKKGSKMDVVNYRPISKLCIVSKVFERVVYDQVYAALKNSFSPLQHGFLKGRSTVSNLILFNEYLTEAMDSGSQIDVVYTDYSKAFDRIDHTILISKLQNIGIHGDLLRWFSSYVDMRSQAVVINNYISSWVTIPSGVPQGSLLGPLLFAIFVNDISDCFHNSNLLCFADDMKIFTKIVNISDVEALQNDLARLDDYCLRNKLDLNPLKCSITTFTRKINIIPSTYSLKNQTLQRSHVIRDLGVIHDSKLLFDEHITHIVTKAYKALGFLMRSSSGFKKAKTLKILYCTFVRSLLEYGSQVWNPMYSTYVNRVERIQEKFMKFLCFKLRIPYISSNYLPLCKRFHLLPLCMRRDISDIIFLLKITSNQIDCSDLLNKVKIKVPHRRKRYNPPLFIPFVNTNYRQNSFIYRTSNKFNNICSDKKTIDLFCTSVNSARRLLSNDFFDSSG